MLSNSFFLIFYFYQCITLLHWVSRKGIILAMTWGCLWKENSSTKPLSKTTESKASEFRQLSDSAWKWKLKELGKASLSPTFRPARVWWLYASTTIFTCAFRSGVLLTSVPNLGITSSMWKAAVNNDIFQESEIWHLSNPPFFYTCSPWGPWCSCVSACVIHATLTVASLTHTTCDTSTTVSSLLRV